MPSGFVVFRSYPHRIPAELGQGALEAAGVTAFLEVGPYGPGHETIRVDLLVKPEDVETALTILGPELLR
jgi:hypothetical protein